MIMPSPIIDIVVLGCAGVGKTSFITGEFTEEYTPTMELTFFESTVNTNYGSYDLFLHEYPGLDLHHIEAPTADGYIIMYDSTSKLSLTAVPGYVTLAGEKPVVVVGNKCDKPDRKFGSSIRISVKSGFQKDFPLVRLLRKIIGHEDLEFVSDVTVD